MWHNLGPFQSDSPARSLYKINVRLSRSHPSGIPYIMPWNCFNALEMFTLEIILSKELSVLPIFSSEKES